MPRVSSKTPRQTTGAVPTPAAAQNVSVASITTPKEASGTPLQVVKGRHQTHGAVTPLSGPITNVAQLMNGGKNIAKGSAGSFANLAEYTAYLRTLSLGDLHLHAVSERTVPIDDRERLIRRLEVSWTGAKARSPGSAAGTAIPQRKPFSTEQMAAQQELMRKALRR